MRGAMPIPESHEFASAAGRDAPPDAKASGYFGPLKGANRGKRVVFGPLQGAIPSPVL
jgi:hypothetical protein